ncbi:MAG TPA: hypothetical protein VK972_07945 [Wenzhouxiangella sp.]|nr:hypothetical protein [Wenzhouxiangella sp.]
MLPPWSLRFSVRANGFFIPAYYTATGRDQNHAQVRRNLRLRIQGALLYNWLDLPGNQAG